MMNFSRQCDNPITICWIALLTIVLACGQNFKFHVHDLDHYPIQEHGNDEPIMAVSDHGHSTIMHLSIDLSHADHHGGLAHEIEAFQEIAVLQSSFHLPSHDLLLFFTLIFLPSVYFLYFRRMRRIKEPPVRPPSYLTPLLRAPPC